MKAVFTNFPNSYLPTLCLPVRLFFFLQVTQSRIQTRDGLQLSFWRLLFFFSFLFLYQTTEVLKDARSPELIINHLL